MAMPPKHATGTQSESDLSVNARLTGGRKEKLLNLKRREDMKDQLCQRFKARYGSSGRGEDEVSVGSGVIRREVDKFTTRANMSENNLERLERRMQRFANGGAQGCDNASVSGVSAYTAHSHLSRGSQSRSLASLHGASVISGNKPKNVDWAKLDEYAAYLHEQDVLRQKAGVHALQSKFRQDLDKQVASKHSKVEKLAEEERRFHMNQLVEIERWKEVEQQRAEEMRVKIMKEKEARDEQLHMNNRLRDDAAQKKKEEEAALVKKITQEMEEEQIRQEKKKEHTKASMRKVFEENMADQRQRDDARKLQQENDANAMREYNRILDEQEAERTKEMEARMEKQKLLMEQMQANVSEVQQVKNDDEMRCKRQQEERDRCAYEAEVNKQSRLKQMRQETQAFLFKQMAEKDDRKKQALELKSLQAQILDADSQEYGSIEEQKKVEKLKKYHAHRGELETQMASNQLRKNPAMSETEMKMNRRLLNLVERTFDQRDQEMAMDALDDIGPEDAAVQ